MTHLEAVRYVIVYMKSGPEQYKVLANDGFLGSSSLAPWPDGSFIRLFEKKADAEAYLERCPDPDSQVCAVHMTVELWSGSS